MEAMPVLHPVPRPLRNRPARDGPAVRPVRPVPVAHRGEAHRPRAVALAATPSRVTTEHRLDRISVSSVARVALLFYLTVGALIMAGISVAVYVASELGVITNFERFMQDVGFGHFRVLTGQFVLGAFIIAGAVISLWLVLTIAAAALYNVIATPWGGVRVTLTPIADEVPLTEEPLPTAFGNRKEKRTVSAAGNGSANGKRERHPPRGREGSLSRQRVRFGYTDAGFAGKASDSGVPNTSSSLRRA